MKGVNKDKKDDTVSTTTEMSFQAVTYPGSKLSRPFLETGSMIEDIKVLIFCNLFTLRSLASYRTEGDTHSFHILTCRAFRSKNVPPVVASKPENTFDGFGGVTFLSSHSLAARTSTPPRFEKAAKSERSARAGDVAIIRCIAFTPTAKTTASASKVAAPPSESTAKEEVRLGQIGGLPTQTELASFPF
jgi:hypothetical protein